MRLYRSRKNDKTGRATLKAYLELLTGSDRKTTAVGLRVLEAVERR